MRHRLLSSGLASEQDMTSLMLHHQLLSTATRANFHQVMYNSPLPMKHVVMDATGCITSVYLNRAAAHFLGMNVVIIGLLLRMLSPPALIFPDDMAARALEMVALNPDATGCGTLLFQGRWGCMDVPSLSFSYRRATEVTSVRISKRNGSVRSTTTVFLNEQYSPSSTLVPVTFNPAVHTDVRPQEVCRALTEMGMDAPFGGLLDCYTAPMMHGSSPAVLTREGSKALVSALLSASPAAMARDKVTEEYMRISSQHHDAASLAGRGVLRTTLRAVIDEVRRTAVVFMGEVHDDDGGGDGGVGLLPAPDMRSPLSGDDDMGGDDRDRDDSDDGGDFDGDTSPGAGAGARAGARDPMFVSAARVGAAAHGDIGYDPGMEATFAAVLGDVDGPAEAHDLATGPLTPLASGGADRPASGIDALMSLDSGDGGHGAVDASALAPGRSGIMPFVEYDGEGAMRSSPALNTVPTYHP